MEAPTAMRNAARLGPAAARAIENFRSRRMASDFDFILMPPDPREKPRAFPDLAALCRRIHAERRGAPLALHDAVFFVGGAAEGRAVVAVYTQDAAGVSDRFIGFAWLKGAGWRALQGGLYAAEPDTRARAEAA